MIIRGSMQYSPSGRKRKTNAWRNKRKPKSVAKATVQNKSKVVKRQEIPSMKTTKYSAPVDNSWKVEESKKFTVAPAYNKGAYQVISKDSVEDIGK